MNEAIRVEALRKSHGERTVLKRADLFGTKGRKFLPSSA